MIKISYAKKNAAEMAKHLGSKNHSWREFKVIPKCKNFKTKSELVSKSSFVPV
jgi:hypothetical protein